MGECPTNDIREARHAWTAGDQNVDGWLHQQAGPAYDAQRADRAEAKPTDLLRASMATHFAGLASLSTRKDRCDSTTVHADFTAGHDTFVAVHGLPLAKHQMF